MEYKTVSLGVAVDTHSPLVPGASAHLVGNSHPFAHLGLAHPLTSPTHPSTFTPNPATATTPKLASHASLLRPNPGTSKNPNTLLGAAIPASASPHAKWTPSAKLDASSAARGGRTRGVRRRE